MPRLLKHEVVAKILEIGLIPTFYEGNIETAQKIVAACAVGGAKVVEFTNRGPLAYQVFSKLVEWQNRELPDIVLGAGTILEPGAASLYINSGASFIVGPVFSPGVARVCNRCKVAYVPGCSTPSEISRAEETGLDIIKLFPADVVGPQFIKDMLGPCPWSKLMPSGGVDATRESIFSWIKAGAAAINMGSNLIAKDLVKSGDFGSISKKIEECVAWIREARGVPIFLGVEHLAIYPTIGVSSESVAEWYTRTFDLSKKEGHSSIMVSGVGHGRIEVMKKPEADARLHVAVYVSDFERACTYLRGKGIELEEPVTKAGIKSVYLKGTDPAGNRVHLLFKE